MLTVCTHTQRTVPMKMTKGDQRLDLIKGSKYKAMCEVQSHLAPKISYWKEGAELELDQLSFVNIGFEEEGTYYCRACSDYFSTDSHSMVPRCLTGQIVVNVLRKCVHSIVP